MFIELRLQIDWLYIILYISADGAKVFHHSLTINYWKYFAGMQWALKMDHVAFWATLWVTIWNIFQWGQILLLSRVTIWNAIQWFVLSDNMKNIS